jgi:dTDP-4-dehydrorhamnose 3,5-epimerase
VQFERLAIESVVLLTPRKHEDQRGFFSEAFRVDAFQEHVSRCAEFVQDNHVYSAHKGVLRGLHFQVPPHAQGKLVRCIRGAIFDVAVDIRLGSPTYGGHVGVELPAADGQQLWIPPGFAHGYITLEEECEVMYKVTDYYAPDCDRGLAWNDPLIAIDWRIPDSQILLSEKDTRQPMLADLKPAFRFTKSDS